MTRFLARRFLNYLVLLALASFLTYCLTSLTFHPLDSFIQRHPQPPAEAIHAKAVQLGLDKTVPIRYANWISRAVAGDFGTTVTGHPVSQELWRRIGVSLRLVVIGSVLGTVAGVIVGAWGAVRQYRLSDRVITVFSTEGYVDVVDSRTLEVMHSVQVKGASGLCLDKSRTRAAHRFAVSSFDAEG